MTHSKTTTPRAVVVAGKLIEALVFAPIGAGATLVTDSPAAVARVRQELSNARFIGQMVVGQGAAQLKQRLEPAEPAESPTAEPPSERVLDAPALAATSPHEPTIGELALPDYDHLPAIDIVAQLESLSPTELEAVESYERANRRRRTVLGKIAQLTDS